MVNFHWVYKKVENIIGKISESLGVLVSFLILVVLCTTIYEIICRYFLNNPTIWVWDINTQLFAMIVFIGGPFHIFHRQIIYADILYGCFSEKGKRISNVVAFVMFIIFFGTLLWKGIEMAYVSILQREYSQGFFRLPLYPIKTLIPISAFLIIIQYAVIFIQDFIDTSRGGINQ